MLNLLYFLLPLARRAQRAPHFTTAGVCQELGQRQGTSLPGFPPVLVGVRVSEGRKVGQAGTGWGLRSLVPSSPPPGTEGVSGTAWRRHVT